MVVYAPVDVCVVQVFVDGAHAIVAYAVIYEATRGRTMDEKSIRRRGPRHRRIPVVANRKLTSEGLKRRKSSIAEAPHDLSSLERIRYGRIVGYETDVSPDRPTDWRWIASIELSGDVCKLVPGTRIEVGNVRSVVGNEDSWLCLRKRVRVVEFASGQAINWVFRGAHIADHMIERTILQHEYDNGRDRQWLRTPVFDI